MSSDRLVRTINNRVIKCDRLTYDALIFFLKLYSDNDNDNWLTTQTMQIRNVSSIRLEFSVQTFSLTFPLYSQEGSKNSNIAGQNIRLLTKSTLVKGVNLFNSTAPSA